MTFLKGADRNQIKLLMSLDMMIEPDNAVRVIDAYTHAIDMEKLGFNKTTPAEEGRPGYDPRDMLGLYVYGNMNKVRSSRRLSKECHRNIEVRWLMKELEPDFRTISDFRKENAQALKKAFLEFNRIIRGEGTPEFYSIDGSKFAACNAKDRNFTLSKLDDRIDRLEIQIEEYLRQLDENDELESVDERELSPEQLREKIKECSERKERYEGYLKEMEEKGLTQMSLTDKDARLMKTKNTYGVSHNVQTAVESDTHMIADFHITSNNTDHGMLAPSMAAIKENKPEGTILEVTADKGYQDKEDMTSCLEMGIIPSVITPEGKDTYELETVYEKTEVTEEEIKSSKSEDIKKCLRTGVIPEVYKDVIKEITVEEKSETHTQLVGGITDRSEEEILEIANKGYFVRDIVGDKVYCPAGRILRRKSTRKDGTVRYSNKLACHKCGRRDKCTKSKFKVAEFREGQEIAACQKWKEKPDKTKEEIKQSAEVIKTKVRKKVVKLILKPDRKKMDQRKCLSEHPFGTIKRTLDGGYFLTIGREKVTGEVALSCLAYNIKRAINLYGFKKVMEKFQGVRV